MGDKTPDTAATTNITEQPRDHHQQQQQHQQTNNSKEGETHICDFCSMAFPEISALDNHQENCSKQKELLKRYLNGSITFMVTD